MEVLRAGNELDAAAIRDLAISELGRTHTLVRLEGILEDYPSAVADRDGELSGFVLGDSFAPDIIEMTNLLVATAYRGQGLGTRLIEAFEIAARERYRAIVLTNSSLRAIKHGTKRSAVPLYLRLGYEEIYKTADTTLLAKTLREQSAGEA